MRARRSGQWGSSRIIHGAGRRPARSLRSSLPYVCMCTAPHSGANHDAGVSTPNGEHHWLAVEPECADVARGLTCGRPNRDPERALIARYATTTRAAPPATAAAAQQHALRISSSAVGQSGSTIGPRASRARTIFGLLDGVDRVADKAVDVVGREAGITQGRDDRLARELRFASACRLREFGLADTDDRGRATEGPSSCRRLDRPGNSGTAISVARHFRMSP